MTAALLLGGAASHAQNAAPAPKYPETPAGWVAAADYEPEKRGPLLLVETPFLPLNLTAPGVTEFRDDPIPQRGRNGWPLSVIAKQLARKAVRVGAMTVLAPEKMIVLNTRLPDPDIFAGVPQYERFQLLLRALNAP